MTNETRKWIRGGIELCIHGGAAALLVGWGAWDLDISWKEWGHLVLTSFMGNGGLRAIQYFKNNPLPKGEDTGFVAQDGTAIITPPVTLSMNPFSKVQPVAPVALPDAPKP